MNLSYGVDNLIRARERIRTEMGFDKWADTGITEQIMAIYVLAYFVQEISRDTLTVDCFQRKD